MKLSLSRAKLAELVSKGGASAPKTSPVPIVQHARLIAEAGRLAISTTDLNVQAEAVGDFQGDAAFTTTVDAAKLSQTVNRLPRDCEVTLIFDGADLFVKSGRSTLKFATLPADQWPGLDTATAESAVFTLTPAQLVRLFAKTSSAAAINANAASAVNGVFLHCREWDGSPSLAAVGTNGHVAVVVAMDLPEGAEDMPKNGDQFGVVLSFECVASALRLFRESESVKLTINDRSVTFEDGVAKLSARLVEGAYPSYQRIIPAGDGASVSFDRHRALSAIALLETFAERDKGNALECGPVEGGLILAASQAGAEGVDTIEADINGDLAIFGASSLYLKTLLGVYASARVTMAFGEPGRPILVYAEDEADTVAVLMPMRTGGSLVKRLAS